MSICGWFRKKKRADPLRAMSQPLIPGPVQREAFDKFVICWGGAFKVKFQDIEWRIVRADVPVDRFGRFEYRLRKKNEPTWLQGVQEGKLIVLARVAVNDLPTNIHEIAHVQGFKHEDEVFKRCVPVMRAINHPMGATLRVDIP